MPSRDDDEVVVVSRRMNALPIWNQANRADTFRNPAGVALKLANFRAIERELSVASRLPGSGDLPQGMGSYSVLDRVVFEEYYGRFEDVRFEAEAIWAAAGFAQASIARDERGAYLVARDAPIDGGGIGEYEAAAGPGGRRRRGEAALVSAYGEFLVDLGHTCPAVTMWPRVNHVRCGPISWSRT